MANTKTAILVEALRLFAQRGYEGASMGDIARNLSISKTAIYRHYESKQALLDGIIAEMETRDATRAQEFDVPIEPFAPDGLSDNAPSGTPYEQTSLDDFAQYTFEQFRYWTEDSFAAMFRRMLTVEQFRSKAMADLYHQYIGSGVLAYVEDVFREAGATSAEDAAQLALSFWGPCVLLMGLYDNADNDTARHGITTRAREHVLWFMSCLGPQQS